MVDHSLQETLILPLTKTLESNLNYLNQLIMRAGIFGNIQYSGKTNSD